MVSGSSCSNCSNKPIRRSLGLQVWKTTTEMWIISSQTWIGEAHRYIDHWVDKQTCNRWLKIARHWESFLSSFFIRAWIRGGSRFQPIQLTMSYRERGRGGLCSVTHLSTSLRVESFISCDVIPDSSHPGQYWGPVRSSPPRYRSAQQSWRRHDPQRCSCHKLGLAAKVNKTDKETWKSKRNNNQWCLYRKIPLTVHMSIPFDTTRNCLHTCRHLFRVFYLYVFYWIHMIMNALVHLLFCHSLNCYWHHC